MNKKDEVVDYKGCNTCREYEKVYSCKSSKEMWDTLTLAYEGTSQKMESTGTALRASKDLKKLPMEELIGTLKVHGMELNEDKGSTSKAFKEKETCGDTSNEDCSDEDELSFISRKFNLCGSIREDQDGRTTLESTPRNLKTRHRWCAMK
ncbi:hypothetical protein CR513_23964, partial [Mucuna pruriens]